MFILKRSLPFSKEKCSYFLSLIIFIFIVCTIVVLVPIPQDHHLVVHVFPVIMARAVLSVLLQRKVVFGEVSAVVAEVADGDQQE